MKNLIKLLNSFAISKIIGLGFIVGCIPTYATQIMAIVLTQENEWKIVKCIEEQRKCNFLNTNYEPRDFSYDPKNEQLVYISDDGNVRLLDKRGEHLLIKSKRDSFIQPYFFTPTKIVLVKLFQRRSKKSSIAVYDIKTMKLNTLIELNTPVFDPYPIGKYIFYTKLEKDKGIIEIWRYDLRNNTHIQMTFCNAFITSPAYDPFSSILYFSLTLFDGSSQIFAKRKNSKKCVKVVSDIPIQKSPSLDSKGNLYFIGFSDKIKIYKFNPYNKEAKAIEFIKFKKIRKLRIYK